METAPLALQVYGDTDSVFVNTKTCDFPQVKCGENTDFLGFLWAQTEERQAMQIGEQIKRSVNKKPGPICCSDFSWFLISYDFVDTFHTAAGIRSLKLKLTESLHISQRTNCDSCLNLSNDLKSFQE